MIDLKFDHVSKRYRISRESEDAGGVGHPLVRKLRALRHRAQDFWAVRDVSFEVQRGEAVGIIGHNGAGKSTILKLLSNIITPTVGEISINGRLSALLEVGSGFHPELTGRENIYLSGSILGMRRREITAKLDSIVEFAGVRQFIDTPVKRYSSGMYVRLGFSIAAHLDPDILLLDEVLAVGDAGFQAKCMERIDDLRRAGTTIVFISHDLNAVERMCGRVLLMQRGELVAGGPPREVIAKYKQLSAEGEPAGPQGIGAERKWPDPAQAPSDGIVRLRRARVRTQEGETTNAIDIRRPVGVEIVYDVLKPDHMLVPNFHFYNEGGLQLFAVQEVGPEWRRRPRPVGQYVSTAWLPGNFLSEGAVRVSVGISSHIPVIAVHVFQDNAVAFRVYDKMEGDSARGDFTGPMPGVIRPLVEWTTKFSAREDVFEPRAEEVSAI